MQTTLLGLGLALIAAILAAFAAPFFIDWNEWRPQLEAQASALAGSSVTISGNIDLTLLPTPAFVLRNVSVGEPESGTGMRASEMRGSLSLTALLSGRIEADQFVVSRPAIRIAIGKDGRFSLPAGVSSGQELSVSAFVFEAGSLTIEDRRTNTLLLADDFSARGELVAREGPFRIDGGFRLNGVRWILRMSSGRFGADHAGKVRLVLERPADAVAFDVEGFLALADASPRFDGKIVAARRSGRLPWRATSDVSGDLSELRFSNLELVLGEGDLPITLSGEAKASPRANGALEISLESKRIDLDLGEQKAAAAGAAHVLPWLADAGELLAGLPLTTQLNISADGILAGGQLARDVRAAFSAGNGTVALQRLEARLPGRAFVSISGNRSGDVFAGPLFFEAGEPQNFARWLLGESASGNFSLGEILRLKGDLSYAPRELSLRNLDGSIGAANLSGSIALLRQDNSAQRLDLKLALRNAEVDALLPLAKNISDFSGSLDFSAELTGAAVRLFGKPLRLALLSVVRRSGEQKIKRIEIADYDGITLNAASKDGAMEFSAQILRGGGIAVLLEYFSGSKDLAGIVTRYAESHFPLRFTGTLNAEKNGWRASIKSAETQLALTLGELRDNRRLVEAMWRLPDTEISAKGELRFGVDGRFEPALALNFKSSDLRSASTLASRVGPNALPLSGSANLVRSGDGFVFEKLSFEIAGSRGQGQIAIPVGAVSPFSGRVSFDRVHTDALLLIALGRANSSYVELGSPLLANFPGTMKLEIATLAFSEGISLQNATFDIRAGRFETVYENFQAQLAGGKVSGALRVADVFPRVLEIRLDVADVALSELFAAKSVRGAIRTNLALSANGNSQDELLASVSGQGTLQVTNLEIERTDATSVSSVYAAPANQPDEAAIEKAMLVALERGPLKISKLEVPLFIANGIFRSGSAKARAGNTEISLSGSFNLPKRHLEALLNIEVAGDSSVRPGAVVRWVGPLDAPERKIDARALITAITLRAIERGGQMPSNINVPQDDRTLPAKKKRAPAKSENDAAPALLPPSNVLSVPQPRQPQIQN